jgi:hypothetical protein
MSQSAKQSNTRLSGGSMHPLAIACDVTGQNLECDGPLQLRILDQIHFTPSACAQLRPDFVTGQSYAYPKCHRFRSAVQFAMTVTGAIRAAEPRTMRKRCPSAVTS